MGGLIWLRRKRGQIPEFSEAIARLQEELVLTESFADAMIRSGNYKAAAAVIEEQERRLASHHEKMRAAFRPRFRRTHLAAGGIAAVMLIGSASFAVLALRPETPARTAPEAMESFEAKLAGAFVAPDEGVSPLVAAALDEIALIDEEASDPTVREQIRTMVDHQLRLLINRRPSLYKVVKEQVEKFNRTANVKIDEPKPEQPPAPKPPREEPAPQPDTGTAPASPSP